MKDAIGIFSLLIFYIGCVHADSAISLFDISSSQKYIENIQRSFPSLNDSDIPAWVDEWKVPKFLKELTPFYVSGYDFDGSPVYVIELGHWKVAEAVRSYKDGSEKAFELLIKYHDQALYFIHRDGLANNAQGVVMIIDCEGFAISNYASPLGIKFSLRQLAGLERINKVLSYAFFINTNFAAENLIRLGRPLLGNFLDKCEIFGSQKYKWLPQLARRIPTHQLPPSYGGSKDWKPVMIGLEPFNVTHVGRTRNPDLLRMKINVNKAKL